MAEIPANPRKTEWPHRYQEALDYQRGFHGGRAEPHPLAASSFEADAKSARAALAALASSRQALALGPSQLPGRD